MTLTAVSFKVPVTSAVCRSHPHPNLIVCVALASKSVVFRVCYLDLQKISRCSVRIVQTLLLCFKPFGSRLPCCHWSRRARCSLRHFSILLYQNTWSTTPTQLFLRPRLIREKMGGSSRIYVGVHFLQLWIIASVTCSKGMPPKKKGKGKKKGGGDGFPPPPNLDDSRQGALEALLKFRYW